MKGGQGISCFRPRNEGGRQTLRGTWDSAVPGNGGNQMPSPGTSVSLGFFVVITRGHRFSVCMWVGGRSGEPPPHFHEGDSLCL